MIAGLTAVADSVALLLWLGFVPRPTLVLITFLEGGFGLLIGVAIALSVSPSVAKIGEVLTGTSPWSPEVEKHARNIGIKWMIGALFLILIGFTVSAI